MIDAVDFYAVDVDQSIRQGDILLAGVTRLVAKDRHSPERWINLDQFFGSLQNSTAGVQPLAVAGGSSLVMVTSHDCHFDKEWNARRLSLEREGVDREEAQRRAKADDTLDRTFNVCPLIDPRDTRIEFGNLLAGRVKGYLPVPALPADPGVETLVPTSVVDLTYKSTVDRLDVFAVARLSALARAHLRLKIAELESHRSVELGFKVEDVIGKQIKAVDIPKKSPLLVRLTLEDGSTIELLQRSADPNGGPNRSST